MHEILNSTCKFELKDKLCGMPDKYITAMAIIGKRFIFWIIAAASIGKTRRRIFRKRRYN